MSILHFKPSCMQLNIYNQIPMYLLTHVFKYERMLLLLKCSNFLPFTSLLETSYFSDVMPGNHLQLILKFFYFNDNGNYDPKDPARDYLFKILLVVDYFIGKFRSVFTPDKPVAIDE